MPDEVAGLLASFLPNYYSNGYFEVDFIPTGGLAPPLLGRFTSVSGLGMEVEYEVYNEGGSNYPRYFLKEVKPQTLVLEQGVINNIDSASLIMAMVNSGMSVPMAGVITLKDHLGYPVRIWTIEEAHLRKYVGTNLNSNQPVLAVNRIEMMYNGCI